MTLEFEIPHLPKLPNQNMYSHWRVRHKEAKRWKGLVETQVALQKERAARPFLRAKLTLTRCSTREPDFDNMAFSFKPIVDALKTSGLIVDDNPKAMTAEYLWEKAKPRQGKIKVRVESVA